jgi:hypothetical protein
MAASNSLTGGDQYCSDEHGQRCLDEYKRLGVAALLAVHLTIDGIDSNSSQPIDLVSSTSVPSDQWLWLPISMQDLALVQPVTKRPSQANLIDPTIRLLEKQEVFSSANAPALTNPDPISPKQVLGRLLSLIEPMPPTKNAPPLNLNVAESSAPALQDSRVSTPPPMATEVQAKATWMGGRKRFGLPILAIALFSAVLFQTSSSKYRFSQTRSGPPDVLSKREQIGNGSRIRKELAPVQFGNEFEPSAHLHSSSERATGAIGLTEQDSHSGSDYPRRADDITNKSASDLWRERNTEPTGKESPEQSNKTWGEYADLILAQQKRPGYVLVGSEEHPGYLQTAEHCRNLFLQYGRLDKMPMNERRFVGGTVSVAGSFGSMKNNGWFKQRLNHDPETLDAALDHIPINGPVTNEQFDAFAANYDWPNAGVTTASRLLAMKRPDIFVCVNSKNRPKIAAAFSVTTHSLTTFGGYWKLMQRIWKCPWYGSRRPPDHNAGRIWDSRVALLDRLYHDL